VPQNNNKQNAQYCNILQYCAFGGLSGRAVYGVGLRPLACCDSEIESRRRHGCLLWVLCVVG